jgi:chaperonin GroES
MSVKIKPVGNRVVVRRQEAKTTRGGILLPEAAQEKPRQGEVVAVGTGKVSLKVGDRVLFSPYAGTEYEKDFLILSEDDLLAVIS